MPQGQESEAGAFPVLNVDSDIRLFRSRLRFFHGEADVSKGAIRFTGRVLCLFLQGSIRGKCRKRSYGRAFDLRGA